MEKLCSAHTHFTCLSGSTPRMLPLVSNRMISVCSSSDPQAVTCGAPTLSAEMSKEYLKYSVECQEDSACPTAEESLHIEVVLDARQKDKYENYTSSFFIRDISELGFIVCAF